MRRNEKLTVFTYWQNSGYFFSSFEFFCVANRMKEQES